LRPAPGAVFSMFHINTQQSLEYSSHQDPHYQRAMESIDSGRRSAVSLVSLSTNSSGVSQVYSDLEHGGDIGSAQGADGDFQSSTEGNKIRTRREFKARHIQMMGLGISTLALLICEGAAIGIGLFYSSAKVLYFAGPIPACLAFLLMGTVVYSVLVTPKK